MSRWIVPLLLLTLLSFPALASKPLIPVGGDVVEVYYNIYSNGTAALISTEVADLQVTCGMEMVCWPEVGRAYHYLYFLNFTPALLELLPPSFGPENISYDLIYLYPELYWNGSWYVNISYYPVGGIYRFGGMYILDTKNFCIEPTNLTSPEWKHTINGLWIEIPKIFYSGEYWHSSSHNSAHFIILTNTSLLNDPIYGPAYNQVFKHIPTLTVNWTQFPVYFILSRHRVRKNITLFYLNITDIVRGGYLPEDVKIANVTVCKEEQGTKIEGNTTSKSEEENTITGSKVCGPGLILLLTVALTLTKRRR